MTTPHFPCFHCGAEIPAGVLVEERAGDATLNFCCHGCHGAYLVISGAGLDDFYRRREWRETGLSPKAFQGKYQDSYLARFVYTAGAGSAIDIIIDGIRCASCVWLNEKIIGRIAGVLEARVNYATGRARVIFDGSRTSPAQIFSRIDELGYLPRPYTRNAAKEVAQNEQKDLLFRFGTAVFLSMQLMAYAFALYAGFFQGIDQQMKNYLQLFSLLVTTPVVFYCGWPFLRGAWRGIVNGSPNMELLVATGALSSYGYSVYATFAGGEVYFETAAMIVTLILVGRLLENAAKRRASGGIERLMELCSGEAQRFKGEELEPVDPSLLRRGDLILVAPGERFPVDGAIAEGATDVDESAATGEPLPLFKKVGDQVIAGSCNLTGAVRVRCEREAEESFIARVARLVEQAQSRRAPIQRLADRVSAYFVPAVFTLAIATFCWHYSRGGEFGLSLMTSLAVVVIACPCALGLATPTAILAGTGAAASAGVIFKGGDILERLSRVTVAVFDKTGTLTCGTPMLVDVQPAYGFSRREVLSWAAAVERGSLHPIAKAVRDYAEANGIAYQVGEELVTLAGGGVTGRVAGEAVAVGSVCFLRRTGAGGVPDMVESPEGGIVVGVAHRGRYCGCLVLKDRIREDAPGLVSYFKRAGIGTLLFSGDRQECSEKAAAAAGMDRAWGELSPAEKAAKIERLREDGSTVLMVGDGINDAPALSAADVGCAVAGGTDIAMETSDLVLAKPDLERLAQAHRMARRTMAVVRQNLAWAFLYNVVGVPLAMTGRLTPVYAAAAMALSSICVVGNSLRLMRRRNG
ncbi:heavy metal translocating P-type ATPase [Geoanaerobacter pelophilus]|uniref:heavy metal translocating P-type ATPase n=1 Tax=Geoanaerobacter pelophilus TaxID=60036 RepID=UPI000A2674D8|nr:heavy metal translocating P-type ATPase [Geoanaerobacter pelophilus]